MGPLALLSFLEKSYEIIIYLSYENILHKILTFYIKYDIINLIKNY